MPEVGVEPTRPEGHGILSPARLPVPPLRRGSRSYRRVHATTSWPEAGCARREASLGQSVHATRKGGSRGGTSFPPALLPEEGARDLVPLRRHGLQLARGLLEGHVANGVALECGHATEATLVDEIGRP